MSLLLLLLALTPGASAAPGAPLELSLSRAVELSLVSQLGPRAAAAGTMQARGRAVREGSGLLPSLSGRASQTRTYRENLASRGFSFPGSPKLLGPFDTFDARLELTQRIFDWAAFERRRAGAADVSLAETREKTARRRTVCSAALAYLEALRSVRRLRTVRADVEQARRLLELARHQSDSGIAAGLDVVRADTRAAEEEVRLTQAVLQRDAAMLRLQRATGLPLGSPLSLTDSLRFVPEQPPSSEDALAAAHRDRAELREAEGALRSSRLRRSQALAGYWPALDLFGDYGLSGKDPDRSALQTGKAGLLLRWPLFSGGELRGRLREARAAESLRTAELEDLRQAVEEDVLLSLGSLEAGARGVEASRRAAELAHRELSLAQDRFTSGVGDNIEVVEAQTALARARDGYVEALARYQTARLNLYAALGRPEDFRLKPLSEEERDDE